MVRQQALGDCAVSCEINGYCDSVQTMEEIYANLQRNILDAFNEFGVQIMTPTYRENPEKPKTVPQEHWFAAPARPAEGDSKPSAQETDLQLTRRPA